MAKKKVGFRSRDTKTGRFVPAREAKRRPATTVRERIKPRRKKKK